MPKWGGEAERLQLGAHSHPCPPRTTSAQRGEPTRLGGGLIHFSSSTWGPPAAEPWRHQPRWKGLGIQLDRRADDLGPVESFILLSRRWQEGRRVTRASTKESGRKAPASGAAGAGRGRVAPRGGGGVGEAFVVPL